MKERLRQPVALLALGLLSGLAPQSAHALAECTVSASPTAFGGYSPFSAAPLDTAGNVAVSCSLLGVVSLLVSYTISLSAGSSGVHASRTMFSGGSVLGYNLYTNSARTTVWGNGTGGTSTVSDGYVLGLLTTTRNYPVYGRIPAGQNVSAGLYADTITVQVDY